MVITTSRAVCFTAAKVIHLCGKETSPRFKVSIKSLCDDLLNEFLELLLGTLGIAPSKVKVGLFWININVHLKE